jgi:anti-anti-sigma factor
VSAEPLRIDLEESPGALVAAVAGEVDLGTVAGLEEALGDAVSSGRLVVVDLTECGFIDSSGLRALVRARSAAEQAGGSLALVIADPALRRVLEVAALDTVFDVHDSRGGALASAS